MHVLRGGQDASLECRKDIKYYNYCDSALSDREESEAESLICAIVLEKDFKGHQEMRIVY